MRRGIRILPNFTGDLPNFSRTTDIQNGKVKKLATVGFTNGYAGIKVMATSAINADLRAINLD
jgi:hypothetical protein